MLCIAVIQVLAYEILGSPDKRAAFDDFGDLDAVGGGGAGAEAFETEWEFEQFGRQGAGAAVFYQGGPPPPLLSAALRTVGALATDL